MCWVVQLCVAQVSIDIDAMPNQKARPHLHHKREPQSFSSKAFAIFFLHVHVVLRRAVLLHHHTLPINKHKANAMVPLLSLFSLIVFFGSLATNSVVGFAPAHHKASLIRLPRAEFSSQLTRLYQTENEDDEPELIESLMPEEEDLLKFEMQFTSEEMEELRTKLQGDVDAAVDADLADIDRLRENLARDAEASKKRMENASRLEAQLIQQNFMERIGKVKKEFLDSNADFRETTKRIAAADQMAATSGRGVDWGSWGTIGGMDVVVGDSSDMPRLLGSIDSAIKQADGDGPKVAIASENRIMVVSDEQKVIPYNHFNALLFCFRARA